MSDTISKTFPVGRWMCTLSISEPAADQPLDPRVQWSPSTPAKLTRAQRRTFERNLTQAVDVLAAELAQRASAQRLSLHPLPENLHLADDVSAKH